MTVNPFLADYALFAKVEALVEVKRERMPASEAIKETFADMQVGPSLTDRQRDDFYRAGTLLMDEPWFAEDARGITRQLQREFI